MRHPSAHLTVSLISFVAFASFASGCSGSDDADVAASQPRARDTAALASCDKLAQCGSIGPNRTYETREQCDVKQRSSWDTQWPPQDCDGKVNAAQLDLCINSIKASECGNGLDLANVLLNKCPKSKVCVGK